jgi:(p)ppGpp synthase/HD superfamily hydrolase
MNRVFDREGKAMLTRRYEEAVQYALHVHGGQIRKGTEIPYVTHVLAVSGLVLESGGTEDEAIAGLLHDAAEDGGGERRLADIRERFGDIVAGVVKECSDSLAEDSKKKAPSEERKKKHLEDLRRGASKSALLVTAADKLHNARCILADYRDRGEKLWGRFSVDRAVTLQYYESLAGFLESRGVPLSGELRRTVDELQTLAKAGQNERD